MEVSSAATFLTAQVIQRIVSLKEAVECAHAFGSSLNEEVEAGQPTASILTGAIVSPLVALPLHGFSPRTHRIQGGFRFVLHPWLVWSKRSHGNRGRNQKPPRPLLQRATDSAWASLARFNRCEPRTGNRLPSSRRDIRGQREFSGDQRPLEKRGETEKPYE